MSTDRRDRTVVRWRPQRGPPYRLVFEPLADGYERREERWTGCKWVAVGREAVSDVAIDSPPCTS